MTYDPFTCESADDNPERTTKLPLVNSWISGVVILKLSLSSLVITDWL